jgi:hypothetical protein
MRTKIIQEYLRLVDIKTEAEYFKDFYEENDIYIDIWAKACEDQLEYYEKHNLTRQELSEYNSRNAYKAKNVADAISRMRGDLVHEVCR